MRTLVLGGTVFLGRHIVDALLARGHEAVLFHRGKHGADLFPHCEHVFGDRAMEIEHLGARTFDAVVDTSGYLPHVVRAAAAYLEPRTKRYLFVSTINAYASFDEPVDESSAEAELPYDADTTVFAPEHYGALKVLCERETRKAFGTARSVVVRPGLIVGPHDPSDRYAYWVERIARGGVVAAPHGPAFPAQYVDVRDLAAWIVQLLEREAGGTYNAVSAAGALTLGDTLGAIADAAAANARLVWLDEAFLAAHAVEGWSDMPLWIPKRAGMPYFFAVDASRAIAAGLTATTPYETARATLAWLPQRGDRPWKAGLSSERERALLEAWRA